MKAIPYGRQQITDEDIAAVEKVLRSDYLTTGPEVSRFESAFAEYIGSEYAVAVSSGTAALHVCALALNVHPGDRYITTPLTFAASANCIRYCGGEIDMVDIDPESWLIDTDQLRAKVEGADPGTYKGIIPVDFAGNPVQMEAIREIANEYELKIIEDACHAPGGYFTDSQGQQQRCGNGSHADLAIFSFHPVKHIASGEGGMVTTHDPELYEKLLLYRTHGISKKPGYMEENHGGWYYEMHVLGYNYRLSDIHAALGLSQLKRAKEGLRRRKEIAARYHQAFADLPLRTQAIAAGSSHAWHLFVIRTARRKELYDYLRENGIYSQVHYIPLHYLPYYREQGWKKGDFPHAEAYYEECLSIPMYPSLTDEEQGFVIEKVQQFLEN